MSLTFTKYEYNRFMLFWLLNLLPALLTLAAWVRRHRKPSVLSNQRRILFGAGLVVGGLGAVILVSFVILNIADPSRVGHVNVWDGRLLIAGFSAALVGLALALTGRGLERVLSFLSGTALAVLMYVNGLATSI
jgi:hypothetical protein